MIIFDCDNVLSDDQWRIRTIDFSLPIETRYEQYHLLSKFDDLRNSDLLFGAKGMPLVMFTAMEEKFRPIRENWIAQHIEPLGFRFESVMMRANGDYRPTVQVKEEMLHKLQRIFPRSVLAAYDDRQDIIDMYRRNGIGAHKVCIRNQEVWDPQEKRA